MSKEQNIEKEENFPKDPENITKNELHEHFDLDNDGKVNIEDYSEHIDYHCENPEVLADKLEQAKYDRGFKYKKGGKIRRTRVLEYPYTSHLVIRDAVKDLKEFQDYEYGANRPGYATIEIDANHLDRIFSNLATYGGKAEMIDERTYAKGGETISGVRVPEVEYGEVSKTEDERREIIDKHRYAKSIGDTEMADEALEQYRMFCAVKGFKKGGLTSAKAKKILEDGTAQGKKLTDKQKRYFGYIAGGGKGKYAKGGTIKGEDLKKYIEKEDYGDDLSFVQFINNNDKYVLENIDIDTQIQKDSTLSDYINNDNEEFTPNENEGIWLNKTPIIIGDSNYGSGVVLDGYHRIKQAQINKEKTIPAFVKTSRYAKGGKTDSNDTYIEEFIDEDTGESVFIERSRKKQKQIAEDSKSYNKIKKRNQMKAVRLQSELFNISWEIKSLESDLNDIEQTIKENIFETEETAEPEGGPIANRLGAELEDLERRKIAIKKLISKKTQDTYDLEDRLDRLEYL